MLRLAKRLGTTAFVLLGLAAPGIPVAHTQDVPERTIEFRRQTTIESLLRPDDRLVILKRQMEPTIVTDAKGRAIEPDVARTVDLLLSSARAVGRVRLRSAQAVPVQLTRAGECCSWINTRLEGVIEEILYARKGTTVRVGQGISVIYDGGEMQFGGVTVRAGMSPAFSVGSDYVWFLSDNNDGMGWYLVFPPVGVAGDKLVSVPSDLDGGLSLDGGSMLEVERRAKRFMR